MKLKINRKYYDDCVVSRVTYGEFQCFMLELPDLNNQVNISCIPEGTYFMAKRVSPSRGYEVLQYVGVPNRTYIQIHPGNTVDDIRGCQLPGEYVNFSTKGVPRVGKSTDTFNKLMSLLPDGLEVEITS